MLVMRYKAGEAAGIESYSICQAASQRHSRSITSEHKVDFRSPYMLSMLIDTITPYALGGLVFTLCDLIPHWITHCPTSGERRILLPLSNIVHIIISLLGGMLAGSAFLPFGSHPAFQFGAFFLLFISALHVMRPKQIDTEIVAQQKRAWFVMFIPFILGIWVLAAMTSLLQLR